MQKPSEPLSSGDSTAQLLNERGKTHGDYSDHAQITQQIKDAMKTHRNGAGWNMLDRPKREGLEMIVHKIGRILSGNPNFRDHWDDIAGYARLVAERCEK